jgi:hypothetical protein
MMISTIRPEYVRHFPANFELGVLYISEEFETAGHLCCCGCGEKVITPLNPAKWSILREGSAVTLSPSVGNWKYACQSHYSIVRNHVIKEQKFNASAIESVQRRDQRDMNRYVRQTNATAEGNASNRPVFSESATHPSEQVPSLMSKLMTWLRKWWR